MVIFVCVIFCILQVFSCFACFKFVILSLDLHTKKTCSRVVEFELA